MEKVNLDFFSEKGKVIKALSEILEELNTTAGVLVDNNEDDYEEVNDYILSRCAHLIRKFDAAVEVYFYNYVGRTGYKV